MTNLLLLFSLSAWADVGKSIDSPDEHVLGLGSLPNMSPLKIHFFRSALFGGLLSVFGFGLGIK